MVKVELVYVAKDGFIIQLKLALKRGSVVSDALIQAEIYTLHPETKNLPIGIYGQRVSLDTLLNENDRIEIYRPLTLDPKEKRRERARLHK